MNKYYEDVEKVLQAACSTVGYSLEYIIKLLVNKFPSFQSLSSIEVEHWNYVCMLLQLNKDCCYNGYCAQTHKQAIGKAVMSGQFKLVMTEEVEMFFITYRYKDEYKNI